MCRVEFGYNSQARIHQTLVTTKWVPFVKGDMTILGTYRKIGGE